MAKLFRSSEKATWGPISRSYPSISADKDNKDSLVVSKEGVASATIGLLEADILETLANYTFLPTSVAADWLEPKDSITDNVGFENLVSFDTDFMSGLDILQSWIDLGLIYEETGINGSFIRPMKTVFLMARLPIPKFTDIPYNLLHHTVGCAAAYFKILRGELETLEGIEIPRWSNVLNAQVNQGVNAFPEAKIRAFAPSVDKYLNAEKEIRDSINNRDVVTPEFRDMWKFLIFSTKVAEENEELDLSKLSSYDIHIPDILIPIPRDYGEDMKVLKDSASSIAVEVELTNKGRDRYSHTLEKYKNQNRFGSVLWLASPKNILTINAAVQQIGMTASTVPGIYYEEFEVPRVQSVFK